MSKLTKGYGSGGMQAILGDVKTYFEGELAQKANISDIPVITGKADKVTNATSGNLAGLDSNGNLTDSGVSPTEDVTVEGNPVAFDSPFEQDAKSVVVSVKPIQDLHGYDHPWVGGAGKNKLPLTVDGIKAANSGETWTGNSCVIEGVTFTILTDNDGNVTGIHAEGTANNNILYFRLITNLTIDTPMIFSSGYTYTWEVNGRVMEVSDGNTTYKPSVVSGIEVPVGTYEVHIAIAVGTTVDDDYLPMIRLATESDATFAPYSNECPISGIDEVEIEVSDGESEPTTTTLPLPSTLYGGEVDVTEGSNTLTYGMVDENDFTGDVYSTSAGGLHWVDLDELSKINGDGLSNMLETKSNTGWFSTTPCLQIGTTDSKIRIYGTFTSLEEFKTQYAGLQVCYELATPTTISLTPTSVELLEGTNVVTTNGEKVAVTYKAGIFATLGDIDYLNDKVKTKFDKANVAIIESGGTASKTYYKGDYIVRSDGCLYDVTAYIASGAAFTNNNTHKTNIGDELNKFKVYVATDNSPVNGNDVASVSMSGYLPISPFQVFSWSGSGTVSITQKSSGGTWNVSGDVSNVRYGQIFMRT